MKITLNKLKQIIKEEVKRSGRFYEPQSLSDGDESCPQCGSQDVALTPNGICDDCDDLNDSQPKFDEYRFGSCECDGPLDQFGDCPVCDS